VEVTTAAVERFERRLIEEARRLREEINGLRRELRDRDASLRLEISGVRQEIRYRDASLRTRIGGRDANLRLDMTPFGTNMTKWAFAFGFGNVIVVATVVWFMLRMMQS
jgi:hypothetical protein